MENSVFCRKTFIKPTNEPLPVYSQSKNYEIQENENGERKAILRDPVAPSMAFDYSVKALSITSRNNSPVLSRVNIDPVDLPENVTKLIDE